MLIHRHSLICLIVIVALVSLGSVRTASAADTAKPPQHFALLVGVDHYVYIRGLKYCVADQESLAKQLMASGYPEDQVFLLSNNAKEDKLRPFKSNIETQLKLVLELAEKGDTLLISFSGHGVHLDGHSYLCPTDAKLEDPPGTMVSMDKVYNELATCKASLKFLIVDACRNDPHVEGQRTIIDTTRSMRAFNESLEKPPEGISLLASCAAGQFAREDSDLGHGVFIHFVLEGLRGKAADEDGVVSLMRLADYTSRETKKYVARKFVASQTPYFRGEISGPVELARVERIIAPPPVAPTIEAPKAPVLRSTPALDQKIVQLSEKLRINPRDSQAYYDRGEVRYAKGDYDKAIDDYTEVIRIEPNSFLAYNALGNAWHDKGEYDKALVNYNEAIRLDPKNAVIYSNRGSTFINMNRYDRAIENLDYALWLDRKNASAYKLRGDAWREKQEHDKAIADYDKAIQIDAKFTLAYNNRGLVRDAKGEHDKAIADYTSAIKLNSEDPIVFHNRGESWRNKKEYLKAINDFGAALRLNPHHVNAFNSRGIAWEISGDFDKAIADYTEAIRLDPLYKYGFCNRGDAWRKKGDQTKAIADYSQAIRLDPQYALAYNNRGVSWETKDNHDQAITDFTEAIRLDAKFKTAYDNRGDAWLAKGDYDRAIADYSEAIRIDPKFAMAYCDRGWAQTRKGEYEKALADCDECIRLDPKYARAHRVRGASLAKLGKYKQALAGYAEAIRLDPSYVKAYVSLASLRATCPDEKLRDGKQALELAKKASDLDGGKTTEPAAALAAAHAELANFEQAIQWQTKAIELATNEKEKQAARTRLQLYQSGQPHREPRPEPPAN